jgi:succinate-semialdehyde dehydrogenase/glutarate-semialdehyde dehydrogenase
LIDGEWRDPIGGETVSIVDPASQEVIGKIAHARHADLDLTLDAAKRPLR